MPHPLRAIRYICHTPFLQVHRTIDELFGYFLETKSYTEGGPPKRKRMKMNEAEEISSVKDPCIAVKFRKKVWREEKRKKKRSDNKEMGTDDYFTSFVIKKENLVCTVCVFVCVFVCSLVG